MADQLWSNWTVALITEVSSTNMHINIDRSSSSPFFSIGVLACLDGYMNIALDQTEEYANGQLKNKYGDAFIRGNNVLYISTQKRRV